MAVDQLGLYNDALLLLGQRALSSLTEDREPRHRLDDVYNLEAINYCLELSKPTFARKTSLLTTSSTSANHDLDNVYTLPTDYVTMIAPYSDANLDQEIKRFILEGRTIACNYSSLYLRYISNGYALTDWTPSFTRVVAAYLAREVAERLSPDKYDSIDAKFTDRVSVVKSLSEEKEPGNRPTKSTVTLSNLWRNIYNDALFILGLDEITSNDDDSNRRTKLDTAINSDLVESVLEDTGWNFGLQSIKSDYDPSLEPEFGYERVHEKPIDMQILHGIFTDGYMESPLKSYKDEGDYIFCALDTVYIQYVDDTFLSMPSDWPVYFRKLIAARLAKDTAMTLGGDQNRADEEYRERKYSAMSTDVMGSPPRTLSQGNWVGSRYRGGNRGRPGDS